MTSILANQTTRHALTGDIFTTKLLAPHRYPDDQFIGVLIDTGAARVSTAGVRQLRAYMKAFGDIYVDTLTAGSISIQFGIGKASSIGSIKLPMPIGTATFHILTTDTPFLLCLQDMDQIGAYYNNLQDQIVFPGGSHPVVRNFGHPFIIWGTPTISYLTEPELRQLHRRFGHPTVERLSRLLHCAGHNDPEHEQLLRKITDYCSLCQKYSQAPRRFKFTLRDDDIEFNHTIYVDVMYINGSPILHTVNEATMFQAARWLDNMSAQHTWDSLRLCWIDTYLRPPDLIVHDAGTNFTGSEFQQNAQAMHIRTKGVPTEASQSMGIVERYHAPLRRAYEVIADELQGTGAKKGIVLQMAVKAVNDTVGPNGLIPTLLVFGAYPRMSKLDPPSPSVSQRATAIQKATQELVKLRASRQVRDALGQRNGPNTERLHDLTIGSQVLVWRTHEKAWKGPFKLLSIDGETVVVAINQRPTSF